MKRKSKQMLIASEIIGAFMILIGVLALMRDSSLLSQIFFYLFLMTIVAAVVFVIFLIMAIKEHKMMTMTPATPAKKSKK